MTKLGEGKAQLIFLPLLCFATFIFDTLAACTRLARYVLMELLGWTGTGRALLATGLTLLGPLALALLPPAEVNGQAGVATLLVVLAVWLVAEALLLARGLGRETEPGGASVRAS